MTNLDKARKIQDMIAKGQLLEAFDQYYHNDVVMQEAGEAPMEGKAANRAREEAFVGMIKEVHAAGVDSITANDETNTTAVESWMEFSTHDGNRMKMEQVAIQKWSEGQVIAEKFYHK